MTFWSLKGCIFDRLVALGAAFPNLNIYDWKFGLFVLQMWIKLTVTNGQRHHRLFSLDAMLHGFTQVLVHGLSEAQLDYTFSSAPKRFY
jgi:hypothetical protein